jgi:hypothetical protein
MLTDLAAVVIRVVTILQTLHWLVHRRFLDHPQGIATKHQTSKSKLIFC